MSTSNKDFYEDLTLSNMHLISSSESIQILAISHLIFILQNTLNKHNEAQT